MFILRVVLPFEYPNGLLTKIVQRKRRERFAPAVIICLAFFSKKTIACINRYPHIIKTIIITVIIDCRYFFIRLLTIFLHLLITNYIFIRFKFFATSYIVYNLPHSSLSFRVKSYYPLVPVLVKPLKLSSSVLSL